MEDFGGFEAGDAWDADEAEPADPDAFPCFLNPVVGFTPRSEVEARAAERFHDADEPEDSEERHAPEHAPASGPSSLSGAITRPARRCGPKPPPRPDAAQRHASDPSLPPPPVAGPESSVRGGGPGRAPVRSSGAREPRGGRLRAERTYRRGVERFCAVLLRWSVRALADNEHDPTAVGLPPLPEPVARFDSPEHYFDTQTAVALEEARATLARAARDVAGARASPQTPQTPKTPQTPQTPKRASSPSRRRHGGWRVVLRAASANGGEARSGVLAAEAFANRGARDGGERRAEWRRPGTVLALWRVRASEDAWEDAPEDAPELAIVTGSRAGSGDAERATDAAGADVDVPADAPTPLWMAF